MIEQGTQKKGRILHWLKQTVSAIVDPERDDRIAHVTAALQQELAAKKRHFNMASFHVRLGASAEDLNFAKESVYQNALAKGWADLTLTESEREVLNWLAQALEISLERAREINAKAARGYFEFALAGAMEDGVVDEVEANRLGHIAHNAGMSVGEMVQAYFGKEGERFLRGVFAAATEGGRLVEDDWKRLLHSTARLGLQKSDLLAIIEAPARQFVEHVLVEAKLDGLLSIEEERTLSWLLNEFKLSQEFRSYVLSEMNELKQLTLVTQGTLPSLDCPAGIELRAGEIVHLHAPAQYSVTRQLKSGPRTDRHRGTATVTDFRLIFSSPTAAFALGHRSVVGIDSSRQGLDIRSGSRGAGAYDFGSTNRLAYAIYRAAIGRANQTIVARLDGAPDRHIPRDVRQRVWQRYGGRCAECGATEYLELDHIIPVARGGSSSDANVQLLCRRCNSRKSDNI